MAARLLTFCILLPQFVRCQTEVLTFRPNAISFTADAGGEQSLECRYFGYNTGTLSLIGPAVGSGRAEISGTKVSRIVITIHNVHISDAGTYICSFTSGEQVSTELIVTDAPEFLNVPLQQSLIDGTDAVVQCQVYFGHPPATLKWFKDDIILGSRFSVESDGLHIENISMQDRGVYRCFLERMGWGADFRDITVDVLSASPCINKSMHPIVEVLYNEAVDIDCTLITGCAEADVWWIKPNGSIVQEQTLLLEAPHTPGIYTCFARSQNGYDRYDTSLDITVPPLPPISEQIVLSFKGQTIQLSADLDMAPIPEPTYIWRSESRGFIPMEQEQRGGQRVYVTTGGRLVIRNITVCDSGNYSCIVENEHGRSMQVVTLEVFATMPPLSTVALLRFHIAEECESREVSQLTEQIKIKLMELCGCCDVSLTDERLECFSSTVGVYDVIVHQLYGDAFSLVQLFYQQLYVNGPSLAPAPATALATAPESATGGKRLSLTIIAAPVLLTIITVISVVLVGRSYYVRRKTISQQYKDLQSKLSTDNQRGDAGEEETLGDTDISRERAGSKLKSVGPLEKNLSDISTSCLTNVIQLESDTSNHLCSEVEIDSVSHVYISDSKFKQMSYADTTTNAQITPSTNSTDSITCGNAGGMYINKIHDVTVTIPEGTVSEGTVLQLSMSVMLYGPFIFPAGVRPVSSILWLCPHPDVTFSRPIEIVLPHFICCEDKKDTEDLIFLKANHHLTDGQFHFKPIEGESHFTAHTSYGTLHTIHCCLLCIGIKMNEKNTPKTNFSLITSYPRNPHKQPRNVHFGVTYLQPTCMQAFRSWFPESDYEILPAKRFVMQDSAEKKIEICYQKDLPQGWFALLNGSNKILATDVDFWSIWNRNPTELETMEKEKMYPPNFDIRIDGSCAVGVSRFTANFIGMEHPKSLTVEILLQLPATVAQNGTLIQPNEQVANTTDVSIQAKSVQNGAHAISDKQVASTTEVCRAPKDTIGLRELCLELHTVDDWLHLGIYLGIPYTELKAIDAVHYREPHRCRTEMLAFWLNNFQPSWSALIEALELIGMNQLAREMTASHIQKSVNSQKGAESTHRQRLRPVCSPTNELETVV